MTAQVYIVRGEARGVLVVPSAVLGRRGRDGSYTVRVLNAKGEAESRQVTVGLNNNVNAEIKSGLTEGDQVVLGDGSMAGSATNPRRMPGPGGMRL